IILSFFSPTFNHTHYRDVRAIRIDVEPKVRSKVFNFDSGESVAHGAANLQEIERVTLLRSETVHEPQFERAIECCRLRANQLAEASDNAIDSDKNSGLRLDSAAEQRDESSGVAITADLQAACIQFSIRSRNLNLARSRS